MNVTEVPNNIQANQRRLFFPRSLVKWWKSLRSTDYVRGVPADTIVRIFTDLEARQRNTEAVLRSLCAEIEASKQQAGLAPHAIADRMHDAVLPQAALSEQVDAALRVLGQRLLRNQPHYSYFNLRFRDYETALLNIKNLGYELGRILADRDLRTPASGPTATKLKSKLCTQSDFATEWLSYWCQELRIAPLYHRKIWELCYICQSLLADGKLAPGQTGLGFGCGEEALPSLFAKNGARILATDLDPSRPEAEVWRLTGQNAGTGEVFRRRDICPDEALLANIDYRAVDMNELPRDFDGQFDFCWSACSLEHLGSIAKGLDFIENSLRTLKPGGLAVHTMEFTLDDGETIDDYPTVLYQRRHLIDLAARLRAKGYQVADFDFDTGSGVLDRFVDLPPWRHESLIPRQHDAHLKLSVDGFTCTSVGIIIKA